MPLSRPDRMNQVE